METVKSLRQKGLKVRVHHHRQYDLEISDSEALEMLLHDEEIGPKAHEILNKYIKLSPQGGRTIVQLATPDNQELEGVANCSQLDNYNKKRGVQIALNRALKSLR